MKVVLRWPVVEVAQIDSGRYASFLSRMTIYTLSIVGALFATETVEPFTAKRLIWPAEINRLRGSRSPVPGSPGRSCLKEKAFDESVSNLHKICDRRRSWVDEIFAGSHREMSGVC